VLYLSAPAAALATSAQQQVESPDHQLKAVGFNQNCGAIVGDNAQLSLIPVGDSLPNDGGNVFIEDYGEGQTLQVQPKLLGPRKILISHDPQAQIFINKKRQNSTKM
jgi:hypothetical protein